MQLNWHGTPVLLINSLSPSMYNRLSLQTYGRYRMYLYRHYKNRKLYRVLYPSAALASCIPANVANILMTDASWEPEPSIKLTAFQMETDGPIWVMPRSCLDIPNGTLMVIYRQVAGGGTWIRTYSDFHSLVLLPNGNLVDRFQKTS